jgi:hypothetical protein
MKKDYLNGRPLNECFDEFGDIVLQKDEIALIRGGWYDRNGTYIYDTIDYSKPCSCNIIVDKVITPTYNTDKHGAALKSLIR